MSQTTKARPQRASGLLLHPTSLPSSLPNGDLGIGDLGPAVYAWIDSLVRARQSWWQMLPLGPTGPSASPYQSYSTFAGNPMLVSPEWLARDGLLSPAEFQHVRFTPQHIDFSRVVPFKTGLLDRAWENFRARPIPKLKEPFERFVIEQAAWLDDYALFMALKQSHDGASWLDWPEPERLRRPDTLNEARRSLAERIDRQRFHQFLFFRQWAEVRTYARRCGIRLIGDLPIFVNGDSADVWSRPELFLLDADGRQTVMAGVPPDYFAQDGQLWGNPLYDWEAQERTGFSWWAERIRATLNLVDLVRIDHFRAFAAAWHIPAGAETAKIGEWIPGPGKALFDKLREQLGGLPLIAEDLGIITPDVIELRDAVGLPGMCVLQFAFDGDPLNRYLPHHFIHHSIVYTGTHDNDTTRGWYLAIPEWSRDLVRRYLGRDGSDIAWDIIRLAWASVADLAFAPMQDVLNLGSEARMNVPGVPEGNWHWRMTPGSLREEHLTRLADLTYLYGRRA